MFQETQRHHDLLSRQFFHFFLYCWSDCRNCCVLFPSYFIENQWFTETGKKAACTFHLPSLSPPIFPSDIHTVALKVHRYVRNITMLHLEQKKFFEKFIIFGSTVPLTSRTNIICYYLDRLHLYISTLYITTLGYLLFQGHLA